MIRVVVDNLALVAADALVRPSTDLLEPTASALRHLERIGGPAFHQQLHTRDPLAVGAATVTGAGDLSAEFVIHAVIRSATEPVSANGVRRAVTSVLQRAVDWEFSSVAIPPLGTGPGNLSFEAAAGILCDVLHRHLRTHDYPSLVTVVVETDEDKAAFERRLTTESYD